MSATGAIWEHCAESRDITHDAVQGPDDEALVRQARLGGRLVLDELYRRHATQIFRVAHRITRHREDAEDAVHDSFLSAYIHLEKFEGRAKFSTWLTRIGVNAALMKVRKKRTSRELSLGKFTESGDSSSLDQFVDLSPNPEQTCGLHEQQAALRAAILRLRPALRRAAAEYLLHDGSVAETAKALGISISATKGRLFQAQRELRESARRKSRLRTIHKTGIPS